MSLRNELKGTGVAIITPFSKNGEVDYAALSSLINLVISNGVEYIVALGTTGETPTLSKKERNEIIDFCLTTINRRTPLVVGVGGNNTTAVLEEIASIDTSGIKAILSASPYYNKPSQEGIYQHYKALAAESPCPVILYNVPARTGSNISAETTIRLAHDCENIAGIKEASGNMVQCMHILRKRPEDFMVVSGDDHLALPLIACGMDGVISVAANCFPRDFSNLIRFALAGDFAKAQFLQYKLLPGLDLLFAENNPAGVKAFLYEMELIQNELRLPLVPLSEALQNEVKKFITQL